MSVAGQAGPPESKTLRTSLRVAVANRAPYLGSIIRYLRAALDATFPTRSSYAENREDQWILTRLRGEDLTGGIYVEVGAGHPSRLSNTYLLYRSGLRGVLIEPNPEMAWLLRRFRPRDYVVLAGCASRSAVRPFFVFGTPADSTFAAHRIPRNAERKGLRPIATVHIPVLPLDTILEGLDHDWIFFLSIDAEGLDHEVLEGARRALAVTRLVCVETALTNPDSARAVTETMEARAFRLVHEVGWNRIYENTLLTRMGACE